MRQAVPVRLDVALTVCAKPQVLRGHVKAAVPRAPAPAEPAPAQPAPPATTTTTDGQTGGGSANGKSGAAAHKAG